ncbi:flavodoxin [Levilactobacillus suantsaii]|uniref:Flavodoxin family protein n=1 Tax=Levilactobacillus suantsaii TaxID=2292255 RepID=A0A4Q0VIT8_9LACO|nr:flavodoxin [Levilactobacillus suantsaii]QMU08076.1 flavodoxin family protein [Levilactobacillus suantsaii]RXI76770.1 flavodoxin family protein [Levilactobacillus suantsaii]
MASNILIAYFSHWGHSKAFAEEIQRLTGGDLFEIQTATVYPEPHDPCSIQAHKEQLADFRPALTSHVENMDQYDTVFIGHPIWWYREPMVIRSFWEAYDFTGKKVIPFCTSGDVGIENTEQDTRKWLPTADVKPGLRLETHAVDSSVAETKEWLKQSKVL